MKKEYENYLHDLGVIIREKALQAKHDKEEALGTGNSDYQIGHLMAFYEVVDLMQQQADAFNINLEDICLNDISPDVDLL